MSPISGFVNRGELDKAAQGLPIKDYPKKRLKHAIVGPNVKFLRAKQAAWLVLRHPQKL